MERGTHVRVEALCGGVGAGASGKEADEGDEEQRRGAHRWSVLELSSEGVDQVNASYSQRADVPVGSSDHAIDVPSEAGHIGSDRNAP